MFNFNNLLMKKKPTATYHKNAMQKSSNKFNFVKKVQNINELIAFFFFMENGSAKLILIICD